MKLVTCFGGLYRLTNKQYREQLISVTEGNGFNAGVGTFVADCGAALNVTDITADDAQHEIDVQPRR